LPEAQLDRFMMKIDVSYSTKDEEKEMYKKLNDDFESIKINKILNKRDIINIQKTLKNIYVSDNIFEYVSDIIDSTRNPKKY
jgi:MoxR-like ATPase